MTKEREEKCINTKCGEYREKDKVGCKKWFAPKTICSEFISSNGDKKQSKAKNE